MGENNGTTVVGGSVVIPGGLPTGVLIGFKGQTRIAQILGAVSANLGKVEGIPAENATRWILDVHQDDPSIEIALRHKYAVRGAVLRSYSFAPLSPEFYAAQVHVEEGTNGAIVLKCARPCAYRLAVDTIHSASR